MFKLLKVLMVLLACSISIAAQNGLNPIWISGIVSFRDSTNHPYEVILKKDSTRLLDEVVVTSQKVNIREEGLNYTISNIQGSDLSDAGTMLDMMAWVPGVSLDASENIQVIGVSGPPLVYINGTKVTDKTKLQSLSSNTVKKIEVIRAPGAEYPSGTGSVIKITTATPLKDIINANLIERANQRNRFSNRITANAFGSTGKFDFLVSVGYYRGNSRQTAFSTESIYAKDASLLRNVSTYQKDLIQTSRWNWLTGVTYHPSENNKIQIEYSGNTNSRHRDFVNERSTTIEGVSELTNYDSRNTSKPDNHTLLANYSHNFSNSSLNISATYNLKQSDSKEHVFLMPENTLNETNTQHTSSNMWTLQGDYSWKLLNKYQQNIGLYGGRSESKSKADYTFMGQQNVNGAVSWGEFYYSSSWNIKGYSVTPGVRFRYEKQESKSLIESDNSSYNKSYFNVVPQLSIFHRFTKKFAMNLYYKYSYSLPTFSELRPTVTLSDLIYYQTGNPSLKIPRRHELALVFNLPKVSIVAEYYALQNKIAEITTPIENSDYFLIRPENMAGNYHLRLSANYNLKLSNKFRMYANAIFRRTHTEYYYLNTLQKRNKITAILSLNASYNIRSNFSIFMNAVYASPQLVENRNVGYSCDISFGGNLRLLKSRLSLRLSVDDILSRSVTPYWTSFSPNLYRTRRNHYDTRGINLTATYRFTVAKKKYSKLDNADDYYRM